MSSIAPHSVVKGLAFDVLLRAAIEKTVAALPILNLPLIKPIVVWLFTKIGDRIYTEVEDHMQFKAIDVDEDLKVTAHNTAVKKVFAAKTMEELREAENEYRKTFANLIRFNSE